MIACWDSNVEHKTRQPLILKALQTHSLVFSNCDIMTDIGGKTMQTAIKINTRVLAGCRVEFTSPELVEGEYLELIVLKDGNTDPKLPSVSALDPVYTLHKDSPEEGATTLEKWGCQGLVAVFAAYFSYE